MKTRKIYLKGARRKRRRKRKARRIKRNRKPRRREMTNCGELRKEVATEMKQ